MKQRYRRILLKLSGEILAGEKGFGIQDKAVVGIAGEVAEVRKESKVQIAIVVGGGNIWRAINTNFIGRVTADQLGMLATLLNALALQDVLEKKYKIPTRVQTAIEINKLAEPCIKRRAVRHLEKGRIVIFAGGTGNPYFTTDTAAVLRAVEIEADSILKATKVEGVYERDPLKYFKAKKFRRLSYQEALERKLKIMDATAFTLCQENKLPIIVFNMRKKGNLKKVIMGKNIGTIISG